MWLFVLPALLINGVVILVPALLTFAVAFMRWDGIGTPSAAIPAATPTVSAPWPVPSAAPCMVLP